MSGQIGPGPLGLLAILLHVYSAHANRGRSALCGLHRDTSLRRAMHPDQGLAKGCDLGEGGKRSSCGKVLVALLERPLPLVLSGLKKL